MRLFRYVLILTKKLAKRPLGGFWRLVVWLIRRQIADRGRSLEVAHSGGVWGLVDYFSVLVRPFESYTGAGT